MPILSIAGTAPFVISQREELRYVEKLPFGEDFIGIWSHRGYNKCRIWGAIRRSVPSYIGHFT
jgi:hypothetical protein